MKSKVSLIVLNWNGKHHLERCLSSLLAQTYPDFEVILVDNASTDGSVEFVRERFPKVKIIRNDKNLGFAAGNNVAIKATQGNYVATLNNDTQVDPHWLEELVKAAEADPKVGMCASKMLFLHQPDMINSTGISLDKAGIAWDRRGGEPDQDTGIEPIEIFGPCAGAALYRRRMLEEVGLFDEDFFAYLEDVDLAWRARLAGWRCLYVPKAVVYHLYSATGIEGSPLKNFLLGRNKVWTIVKNYPSPELFLFLPIILLYDLASILYTLLVKGDTSSLQGRVAGLQGIPKMLRKRKIVQSKRITSLSALAKSLTPLERPFKVWQRYSYLRQIGRRE